MKIGYARVSTEEQDLTVQVEQLKAAGCKPIFTEKASAKQIGGRPVLERILRAMEVRPGKLNLLPGEQALLGDHGYIDVLVVTKLDRLARSTSDLLAIVERIGKAGCSFVSLSEPWADTTSPAGKLIMTVFAGVAQFERERMLERCEAGRKRAKQDGVKFGRKPKLTGHQRREALARVNAGEDVRQVARSYNVDRATIYRLKASAGATHL